MLVVKNLSVELSKPILNGINLRIKKGAFLAIVGPSGEGKSTLLKAIAGLLDWSAGKIELDGYPILGPKDKLIPGIPEIQLVNQDFALDLFHTVEENLRVKMSHLNEMIRSEFISELLEIVDLESQRFQKANTLSGGEQQRLAFIRALALEPDYLLLDEPFVHIDAHLKQRISNYLLHFQKVRKTAIVLVSHDAHEILHLAKEIAYFKNGCIQRIDSPSAFYNSPHNEEEALYFGPINSIKHKRKTTLFRPHQFRLDAVENSIQIDVKYLQTHFYGIYELHEFQTKFGSKILLNLPYEMNKVDLQTIYVPEKR